MTVIEEFHQIVIAIIKLLKTLMGIEQEKLQAITQNDLQKLDACIKEEQAQVLKLRGLDRKRDLLLVRMGYENLSFKEIIDVLPQEDRAESRRLYNELQRATDDFNNINASVRTALEVNLHNINAALESLKIPPAGAAATGHNLTNRFA